MPPLCRCSATWRAGCGPGNAATVTDQQERTTLFRKLLSEGEGDRSQFFAFPSKRSPEKTNADRIPHRLRALPGGADEVYCRHMGVDEVHAVANRFWKFPCHDARQNAEGDDEATSAVEPTVQRRDVDDVWRYFGTHCGLPTQQPRI